MYFLLAYAIFIVANYLSTLVMAVCGCIAGTVAEEIGLFIAPPLISWRWRKIQFRINAIPLPGSYVRFLGQSELVPVPNEINKPTFQQLHPVSRALIVISGCGFLVLIAILILGVNPAIQSIRVGVVQLINGIIAPATNGKSLCSDSAIFVGEHSVFLSLGHAAAKTVAVNMFPVPLLPGWQFAIELLRWRKPQLSFENRVNLIGVLCLFIVVLRWGYAIVLYYL